MYGLTSIKFSFDGNFQLAVIAVIVAGVMMVRWKNREINKRNFKSW